MIAKQLRGLGGKTTRLWPNTFRTVGLLHSVVAALIRTYQSSLQRLANHLQVGGNQKFFCVVLTVSADQSAEPAVHHPSSGRIFDAHAEV